MRRHAPVLVLLLVLGCSSQAVAGADYVLREGAIDGPNNLTVSNPATIQVTNTGDYSHTLVVTDHSGQVIGATGLVESGDETSLEVDLEAGTYVFSCRIVAEDRDGNLVDHYEQGMHRTVVVGG